jgi:hypothetical protein
MMMKQEAPDSQEVVREKIDKLLCKLSSSKLREILSIRRFNEKPVGSIPAALKEREKIDSIEEKSEIMEFFEGKKLILLIVFSVIIIFFVVFAICICCC